MTTPAELSLNVYRGDTLVEVLRFWTDSTKTAGLDVSDRVFTAQLRRARDTDPFDLTVDMTQAAPASPSDPGIVVLTLDATTTESIEWDVGVWDLQQVITGVVTTLLKGAVVVEGDVTRSGS